MGSQSEGTCDTTELKRRQEVTGYKRKAHTSRSGGPQRKRNKGPERQVYKRGILSSVNSNTPSRKKIRQAEKTLQERDIGPYNLWPRIKVSKAAGSRSSRGETKGDQSGPEEEGSKSQSYSKPSQQEQGNQSRQEPQERGGTTP
ncbi:hypothetical protein TNIN_455771 [Trichonephila inaurata madagascariensis]|uniref:Uncharacterized protein n=1 Tax=Trichonephila inaurata madagascariensis TaxID=2747483 RepID=A0A8X6YEH8_9ARAC|nr:hypothetical protein TNIN_455771 [Trichonephila inaurata madagascariensis]